MQDYFSFDIPHHRWKQVLKGHGVTRKPTMIHKAREKRNNKAKWNEQQQQKKTNNKKNKNTHLIQYIYIAHDKKNKKTSNESSTQNYC